VRPKGEPDSCKPHTERSRKRRSALKTLRDRSHEPECPTQRPTFRGGVLGCVLRGGQPMSERAITVLFALAVVACWVGAGLVVIVALAACAR